MVSENLERFSSELSLHFLLFATNDYKLGPLCGDSKTREEKSLGKGGIRLYICLLLYSCCRSTAVFVSKGAQTKLHLQISQMYTRIYVNEKNPLWSFLANLHLFAN